jgi:NAD(P)H-hydrate epimerase
VSETPSASPLTREQARELDRKAIQELGIPSVVLMELAGLAVAREAEALAGGAAPVVVVAGPGNNGGDGYVAARHLTNRGTRTDVLVFAPEEQVAGDARVNLDILLHMGVRVHCLPRRDPTLERSPPVRWDIYQEHLEASSVLVDALLGTGLRGEVREPARQAITLLNEAGKPVVAVDIPSGLDCDTGQPLGVAVRATVTVTFARAKVGLLKPEAAQYLGRLVVADIGIPPELAP